MTPVIAVLAHGRATHVDEATKLRIESAFHRVKDMVLEPGTSAVILFMAGVGKEPSRLTLAERMALYAREYIEKNNIDERDLRIHYNRHDPEVWGTPEEMHWAAKEVGARFPCPHIEYVTNARHAIRVRLTARMLGQYVPHMITSSDAPSPLSHELCAYAKLAAYPFPTLYQPLQVFRRKRYSGG